MLQVTASMIDNKNTATNDSPKTQSESALFNHWQFHPSDIRKNKIQSIYNNTLQGHDMK
jgi:hypothetical protein